MPTPHVRDRRDHDLPTLAAILPRVHRAHGYPVNLPEHPSAWLTPDAQVRAWVADLHDQVAGHVCLTAGSDGDPSVWVERLFVDPQQNGHGIGRLLLATGVDAAAERDLPVRLEVADNCTAAIGLYRALGWTLEDTVPITWGKDLATSLLRFSPPRQP